MIFEFLQIETNNRGKIVLPYMWKLTSNLFQFVCLDGVASNCWFADGYRICCALFEFMTSWLTGRQIVLRLGVELLPPGRREKKSMVCESVFESINNLAQCNRKISIEEAWKQYIFLPLISIYSNSNIDDSTRWIDRVTIAVKGPLEVFYVAVIQEFRFHDCDETRRRAALARLWNIKLKKILA